MYDFGDIVMMKKPHACQTNRWQIIRTRKSRERVKKKWH